MRFPCKNGRFGVISVTLAAATLTAALAPTPARAAQCRVMDFQFTPSPNLQIVVWLEDASGHFVDTIYMTQTTARYGLGNRPGSQDLHSEWMWPYGRREGVLPVWAHRHGVDYPKLVFQDGFETRLSHSLSNSSQEHFYCRPLTPVEGTAAVDSMTCPTAYVGSDKGHFSATERSLYPPRADLPSVDPSDSADVAMFATLNDLDAVSRATPPGRLPFTLSVPSTIPAGDYVAFIEVSEENDFNATYNATTFPGLAASDYSDRGAPYQGQPSLVWKAPIHVDAATTTSAVTLDFAGYGDEQGINGTLNPPDATITTGTEGSGAGRLLVASSADGMYRFRVVSHVSNDTIAPGAPGAMSATAITAIGATVQLVAPGNDGDTGTAAAYDIRFLAGAELTDATFGSATPIPGSVAPVPAGMTVAFTLDKLTPQTHYSVGVRALDGCNVGPVAVVDFDTPPAAGGNVSTCFVATAAFGSPFSVEVALLRRFRDRLLRRQLLGELFVETYYTFGPGLARTIAPSDTLRQLARGALIPIIDLARGIE